MIAKTLHLNLDIETRSHHRKCHRAGRRIVYLPLDFIGSLGNVVQAQTAVDPVPSRRRLDALRMCLDGLAPVYPTALDFP